MNYITLGVASIALVLGLWGVLHNAATQSITLNEGDRDRTVTVTGESEKFVAPDTAEVSFSMMQKTPKAQDALNSVNGRMEGLVSALKALNIEESDIKTVNYSVAPQYKHVQERVTNPGGRVETQKIANNRVFDGYRVQQDIRVIIRDLNNVENVMTRVGELKVDNLSGLTFRIDDDESIREELRSEAIAQAKEKAKILSKDLGVRLTTVVGFSEGGGYNNSKYDTRMFDAVEGMPSEATIPVGENRLATQVSVTFIIE